MRWIVTRCLEIGSGTELAPEVGTCGIRTPRVNSINKKYLHRMLPNRTSIGKAVQTGKSDPGERDAIIDRAMWGRVHAILQESRRKRSACPRADTPAALKGLLFGPDDAAFSPRQTRKRDKLDHTQASQTVLKHGPGACPVGREPAQETKAAVIDQLHATFRPPEIVAGKWKAAWPLDDTINETDVRRALQQLDPLWDEPFPAEQARIVALRVERVDIGTDGLSKRLRIDGLGSLARAMPAGASERPHDPQRSHPRHRDAPHPIPHREARRTEGKRTVRRRVRAPLPRRCSGQGPGRRLPLEADAGAGRVRHHRRTGRARGNRFHIHDK